MELWPFIYQSSVVGFHVECGGPYHLRGQSIPNEAPRNNSPSGRLFYIFWLGALPRQGLQQKMAYKVIYYLTAIFG